MSDPDPNPEAAMRRLQDYLEGHGLDAGALRNLMDVIHPADLAYLLEDLELEEKVRLFEMLEPAMAADVLSEVGPATQQELIEHADRVKVTDAVKEMAPDDTADLLEEAPPGQGALLLQGVSQEQAEQVRALLQYPPGTAGGLMTSNIIRVRDTLTAADALHAIQGGPEAETLETIFIVDEQDRFRGVVSLRALLRATPQAPIASLLDAHVSTIAPSADQEEVARVVAREDVAALPVVDGQGTLLGVVTHDDVIDVIQAEAIEDMYKIAGTAGGHPTRDSVLRRVFLRIPWLLPTMAGSFLVGWLMNWFSIRLGTAFATLACFIPIMMATGGNVGLQCSTLMVRGLATGDVGTGRILRVLFAEARVGFTIGLICGSLTGLGALFFDAGPALGVVVAFAMWTGVSVAATAGTLLPIACNRIGIDPAISAGPFITALNDLTATLIYLSIASYFLVA